jgi:hypothetical protein
VTKPERRHVDEGTVVGLEGEAQVELEDAVSPEEGPIAAAGQHLPAQSWALEVTARYRGDDARTVGRRAELLRVHDRNLQGHQ